MPETDPSSSAIAPQAAPAAIASPAGVVRSWLLLALTLIACLPALLIDLGSRVTTQSMESKALVSAQEMWLKRHEGVADACLVTTNDGILRVEKPPMLAWLNLLAWSDLSPEAAPPTLLIWRARLVTVALGLVMLASLFWLGNTLGGLRLAGIATIAVGSMFFFQRQCRWAQYDMHFSAWVTLAVAAAGWAVLPGSAGGRGRRVFGWTICSLATAMAIMSKNPLGGLLVAMPVAGMIILRPREPGGSIRPHVEGLIAALAAACLITAPWYIYVIMHYSEAAGVVGAEFIQRRQEFVPPWYYVGLVVLVAPWSAWMICGLVQPFVAGNRDRRRVLLVPWIWFAALFIFFSIPAAKQQRYIIPALPAVGLMIAHLMLEYDEKTRRGMPDRFGMALGHAIWAAAALVSLVMAPFVLSQDWLTKTLPTLFPSPVIVPPEWPLAAAAGAALVIVAAAGWHWHAHGRPLRSAAFLAVWSIVLMTAAWHLYAEAPSKVVAYKREAERIAAKVGDSPLRSLRVTSFERNSYRMNEEFRLYFGRLIRHVTPEELAELPTQATRPVYVLAKPKQDAAILRDAGYSMVDDHVLVANDDIQTLWMHPGTR